MLDAALLPFSCARIPVLVSKDFSTPLDEARGPLVRLLMCPSVSWPREAA